MAVLGQLSENGPDGQIGHFLQPVVGQYRRGTVRPHAAGIGALVIVPGGFVVLGGGQGHGPLAVAETEEGGFLAHQAFLQHHAVARRAEGPGFHDVAHSLQGFLRIAGHHHALAGGQAVGLDHQGRAHFDHMVFGDFRIAEHRTAGRGHLCPVHDLLGKGLAALKPRAIGVRTETGDARLAHAVHNAQGQRQFGAGHHQIDLFPAGQIHQCVQVVGGHRHIDRARAAGASVAGSHKNFTDPRALAKFPDQGMLAPAGTDHKDAHLGLLWLIMERIKG